MHPVLECEKFAPPQLFKLVLSAFRNDAVWPAGALLRSHEKSKPTFTPAGPASLAPAVLGEATQMVVARMARTPNLARVPRRTPNINQISSPFWGVSDRP